MEFYDYDATTAAISVGGILLVGSYVKSGLCYYC